MKKLLRPVLAYIRYLKLKMRNSSLTVGHGFFCCSGCRISRDRDIKIGDDFYMGHSCYLSCDATIGNNVMFGSNVALVGGDHNYDNPDVPMKHSGRGKIKRISIADNVWVGHGVIILHGAHIGSGAIIGAGSVVTKDVEPNCIVAGNPAKVIKYRV